MRNEQGDLLPPDDYVFDYVDPKQAVDFLLSKLTADQIESFDTHDWHPDDDRTPSQILFGCRTCAAWWEGTWSSSREFMLQCSLDSLGDCPLERRLTFAPCRTYFCPEK